MNEMFKKMLESKKEGMGKEISPVEKQATGDVLQDLMGYLSSLQGDKVKGMKKTTIASIVPKSSPEEMSDEESMEDPTEEMTETPEEEHTEETSETEESPEDLQKQIELLQSKLASRK